MTILEFMKGYDSLEIECPIKHTVMRRLKVEGSEVVIDALSVTVRVPASTELGYDAWMDDRGSILFKLDGHSRALKLCTEWDLVRYPDGTTAHATVPEGLFK